MRPSPSVAPPASPGPPRLSPGACPACTPSQTGETFAQGRVSGGGGHTRKAPIDPALDDENVPLRSEGNNSSSRTQKSWVI
jgi:hypothetical protein